MHNGDDTCYYLAQGYRVVAVDANPSMCEAARRRFAREISTGKLSIRNIGIAQTPGEMDFWVSSTTEWSSFNAAMATRHGEQATCIKVETMPFRRLLEEEGIPFFLKIDIEGSDSLCIKDLAATGSCPAYLSFECSYQDDANDIDLLKGLGYNSFKCLRQNDFREITPDNVVFQQELRRIITRSLARLPRAYGVRWFFAQVLGRAHYRRRSLNGRRYKKWSSGPPAFELPGRWLTSDQILSVWHYLAAYDLRLHADSTGEWFDIHAAYGRVEQPGPRNSGVMPVCSSCA